MSVPHFDINKSHNIADIFLKINVFIFWLHLTACEILVPLPGIQSATPALEAQRLNPWLFSRSVMPDSLQPHGLQHARLSCPSLSLTTGPP